MTALPPPPARFATFRRALAPITTLVAVGLSAWFSNLLSRAYHGHLVDDAMISLVYARNLALGNGLVFNVGERVEGYTNFLWTLLITPLYGLAGGDDARFAQLVIYLTQVCSLLAVAFIWPVGRGLWRDTWLPLLVALLVCVADNAWLSWAIFGMENAWLSVCFMVSLWLAGRGLGVRAGVLLGLSLGATQLTRPDAGLFVVSVLLGSVSRVWLPATDDSSPRLDAAQVWRFSAAAAATWLFVVGTYFAWRTSYFGEWLPNTYHLKAGGELDAWARGLEYTRGFLEDRYWVPLLAWGLGFMAARNWLVRALILHLGLHGVYVTYVGGDFYAGHRFWVSHLPFFGLLLGAGLDASYRSLRSWKRLGSWLQTGPVRAGATLVALVLVSGGASAYWKRGKARGPLTQEILYWRSRVDAHREFTIWLRRNKLPGASVATGLIGHFGFYAHVPVVDMFGVVDKEVARSRPRNFGKGHPGHEKRASRAHLLKQRPTYVIAGYGYGDFWRDGYVFSYNVPQLPGYAGIWEIDRSEKVSTLVPGTAIDFSGPIGALWNRQGTCFTVFTRDAPAPGQSRVRGAVGRYVTSFHDTLGDRATGSAESREFQLSGDVMTLRVGGGSDRGRLFVALVTQGREVYRAAGRDSSTLGRVAWDIRPFHGKSARLKLVDRHTGPWGHLIVDQIEQRRLRK